jgi:hypothetical protein
VVCTINKMLKDKKGAVMVHATCPKAPTPSGTVRVGDRGYLLDPKGAPVKKGQVVVKRVKGAKIVAESRLKKQVKATQVRIYTRY